MRRFSKGDQLPCDLLGILDRASSGHNDLHGVGGQAVLRTERDNGYESTGVDRDGYGARVKADDMHFAVLDCPHLIFRLLERLIFDRTTNSAAKVRHEGRPNLGIVILLGGQVVELDRRWLQALGRVGWRIRQ